jgi:hypothetical protein
MMAITASSAGRYALVGDYLMNPNAGEQYLLDICNPDRRMFAAFQAAGPHWIDHPDMMKIREHRMVVYIVGEGGSPKKAESMMVGAEALLGAGGFGVKIESTGLAHQAEKWREMKRFPILSIGLHQAFVVYPWGKDTYSCGMHNLGYKDAIIDTSSATEPVKLLQSFTKYIVTERPVLGERHTFSMDSDSPRYRIYHEECTKYEEGSLFTNPFGMWRLRPLG